jgi:hypothetical protein
MNRGRLRPVPDKEDVTIKVMAPPPSPASGSGKAALVISILALVTTVAFVAVSAPVVANRISLLQDAVDETAAITAGNISFVGDVTGNTTLNVVSGIQGAPVDASGPVYGDIFTYDGASWTTQNRVNVTGNVTTASHLVTDKITSSTRTSPILVESNPRPQATSVLYLINTTSLISYDVQSGIMTVIGTLAAVLEDIAFCPDGTLYGKGSAGTLYEIDPLTANFTLIASGYPEQANTNTLACSPDGELYGTYYGYIYRYSRTNSSYENLGSFPEGNSNQGDLVFVGSTMYFGTYYRALRAFPNPSDPSTSYDINQIGGSDPSSGSLLTLGFGTTCTDDGVQLWGTNGASLYQIDTYSADVASIVTLPSSASNYNGMTSTCFAAPATALKMRGNLDLDMHDITHVSRMYVDNIYSSGTFTVPSARIHVHDTLNLHSTSRKGTNITFEDDGGTGYRSAIMWRTDTNLYRSTTSTIRTDNRFNVAQTVDSKYEVSANGNVATLGSQSGLYFVGNVPSINGLRTVVVGYDGGSGYAANNILTVTGCGGTGGTVTVTSVSSGVVTAITMTRPGTGYVVGTNCATTGGAGTGASINITAVGSTTVTSAIAYQAIPVYAAGSYVTPAVTTAIGFQVAASSLGNGPVTVGTHIGIDIPATAAVATNAYGIRVAAPTGGTTLNQAMNFVANTLASGGITFGADATRSTNLYRSTTSTLRSDGKLNVAFNVDSTYEISANGNVASAIGASSGVKFLGNIPSISGLLTVVVGFDGGTGYAVNNVLTVTGCSGSGGTVTVSSVSGGVVTAVTVTRPGTGYIVGTNCATTGGAGTGATVNITAIGSTTVTTAIGYQVTPINAVGLFVTPAVTTAIGLQVAASNLGSGPVTVGTHIGVDIPATSAVATNAYGIRLAAPTGGTTINQAMNFVANTLPSGGITFGADSVLANWYRSAASTIKSDGDISVRHVITTAASIPTAAAGAGAGTGPTITVAAGSSDCRMMITVLTGSSPGAGVIFTLSYNVAFPSAVNAVVFSPRNAAAAALSGTSMPYIVSETVSVFTFNSGSAALAATTTYIWNFQAC